jgi:eukaryotic-like serine/threonine-protein kinase
VRGVTNRYPGVDRGTRVRDRGRVIGQTLLGRYVVEQVVAEGGMGVVYRARDAHGGVVGIKRMRTDITASAELLARFEREASVQAMLTHPNIARLFAAGRATDGALFLVMELVEGEGLDHALSRGPIAPARAVAIARQVLSALHYAHQFGLVHRDLKPENVLLARAENGRPEQAKVIDFGLVKLLDDLGAGESSSPGLTVAGSVFGTPEYMSPEHITGGPIDARSDLYAVGVVLFAMLTGRPPFESADITDLWRAHLGAPIPSVRGLQPAIAGPDLDDILALLLAKRPEDRFESAFAAARALHSVAL